MTLLQIIPLLDSYHCFLRELCESLEAEGHRVTALCRITDGNLGVSPAADRRCIHFPSPRGANPLSHLRAARQLARVVEERKPDIVHAHFSAALLTTALARSFTRHPCRWLGTFQGLQFPLQNGPKARLYRHAETYAARTLDHTWVLTPDDHTALTRALPTRHAPRIRLQQSPGFGCADRFLDSPLPAPAERDARRQEHGYTPVHTVFLYVGRLVDFKGFPLLLQAFLHAHRQNQNLRLLVVGDFDPQHPAHLTPEEQTQLTRHPAIRWIRNQPDTLPWFDLSDLFVLPSTREGLSVSIMEALARRLPVLTHPSRGCKPLIQPGINGAFFEANTVESITALLLNRPQITGTYDPAPLRRSHWIKETMGAYGAENSAYGAENSGFAAE
jgi:glycosyltransferase involved in cell wall biosynthesis